MTRRTIATGSSALVLLPTVPGVAAQTLSDMEIRDAVEDRLEFAAEVPAHAVTAGSHDGVVRGNGQG